MPDSPRLCVYTCLLGGYEALNEQPVQAASGVPFFCLTDDPDLTSETWQMVPVEPAFSLDLVRSQRAFKLLPHRHPLLAGYDRSLYVDNAVVLSATPETILERYGMGPGLACPDHPRDRLLDEFLEVVRLGYDDPARVYEQLNHTAALAPEVLEERPFWSGMLLRDHHDPRVRAAMEIWYAHVLRYSRRDQLSANLAYRLAGIAPQRWPIDNLRSWMHSWPHTAGRDRDAGGRHPLAGLIPPLAEARRLTLELAACRAELTGAREYQQGLERSVAIQHAAATDAIAALGQARAEAAAAALDAAMARAAAEAAAAEAVAERAEANRVEAERAEAERVAAERAEAERAEAERVAAKRAKADRVDAERVAADRAASDLAAAARVLAEAEAAALAREQALAVAAEALRQRIAVLTAEQDVMTGHLLRLQANPVFRALRPAMRLARRFRPRPG